MCPPPPPATLAGMNPKPSRPAVITVVAATAVLAAACSNSPSSAGSGGSPTSGGAAATSSGVAYSRCIRSHGVPDFPDPGSNGQLSKSAIIQAFSQVSQSKAMAAQTACAQLSPGEQQNPVLTAQQREDYLRAAACMRSHGFANFPDPTFPGGRESLSIPSSIDTSSTQFNQAARTCTRLIPAGLPDSRRSGG
jgi:hypothetical protein